VSEYLKADRNALQYPWTAFCFLKLIGIGSFYRIFTQIYEESVTDIGRELIKSRVDHLTAQAHTLALLGRVDLNTLKRIDRSVIDRHD
jgi:hypothetical protein